uniref:Tudor domain-containing protein 1 n=1 Tax=Maylandia zebra TaxID=106582 RepID=A0A3P9DI92_9CICH|nr:tudor domain-containing protein 1 [Maylandia zebra]
MNRSFSTNVVRPNLPLRKPSSIPAGVCGTLPPPRHLTMPSAPAVRLPSGAIGDGPINSSVNRDKSGLLGSGQPSLTVHFCNYCGHQGNFRCKRCKKVPYCSVACQTEDWKTHRHVCKAVDPEPVKGKPVEAAAVPAKEDRASLGELKHGELSSLQRVYFKDLHVTKVIKGTDIQARVVEFYSPSRFFLVPQSPELLESLQSISTELQKTYCSSSVTTHVPCVGEICAVQFSCDMNWYRGLVQTLAPDHKMANVLYIDFGNEENVPVDRIRALTADIKPFCPCAMECRITGVVPVAGSWSGECCIAVRQLLAGKIVTVRLVETVEDGRIHAVDILLSMGKQLNTFLLEHGYADKEPVNIVPTVQDINAMMSASLENFRCLSDGKDDNTWAQLPEPITQAVGDQLSVVVTHFQSPTELIVQKVENAGLIQDLQLKLREHCSQVATPQNFRPAPTTVCCAQFSEDKQWYRAKILAYSSEERVCVGYLDFGNSEEVGLGHLRPIASSLLRLPMQAIPCGLAGVQPVGESWPEDCLLALQRRVSNRILHIEIQGAHGGKALVTMIDESSDPQANIAELLISAGYAAPCAVTTDNETVVTAEAQACEPLVWSCTELPCNSQAVALLVTVVAENPAAFYCRIDSPTDHQRLKELGAQLKQHCEADASPFEPKVGEPCCALLPGDGAWCRAMVTGLSDDKVAVNFVDYGYSLTVEKGHLRSITAQLLTLPFQAVRCWLTGVEPLGSEWSSEAVLWFQTQVYGKQLSARVLSVTEQGYGVELESRGVNVAAALISAQLAKVPGEIARETHGTTGSATKQSVKTNEQDPLETQVSSQTEVNFKEIPAEGWTAVSTEVPSFPVEWKTVELPLSDAFQPYFAGIINPSIFYLLGPAQVDQQKLQEVMVELAVYCNSQATLSTAVKGKPTPGAACCAQFSADNNWYRAVILEVGEKEVSVLYADYGNSEKVPYSRILPIPSNPLELPFQITRCTLAGKENFPAEWPQEVQLIFQNAVLDGVLATVQHFDGSANVLSLTLPAEKGGGNVTDMISEALHAQRRSNPCTTSTQKTDKTGSSTSVNTAAAPDGSKPKSVPENQKEPVSTTVLANTVDAISQHPEEKMNISAASACGEPVKEITEQIKPIQNTSNSDALQTSGCCCLSLQAKIDELEELMKLQLSLIQMFVGQKKYDKQHC